MERWNDARKALLWCVSNAIGDCTVIVNKGKHQLVYIFNAKVGELVLWADTL